MAKNMQPGEVFWCYYKETEKSPRRHVIGRVITRRIEKASYKGRRTYVDVELLEKDEDGVEILRRTCFTPNGLMRFPMTDDLAARFMIAELRR
jgi:hypothetical protein